MIRVDNSTGIVDVVSALTSNAGRYDEEVTQNFAAKYVRAREGFQTVEAEENFRVASLLSGPDEQKRFASFYRGPNPQSPHAFYRNATAKITIKSISLVNENVTSVRYLRTVTKGEETFARDDIRDLLVMLIDKCKRDEGKFRVTEIYFDPFRKLHQPVAA